MKFLRTLINNPGKTALAVLAFLALIFSYRCSADEAHFEAGPTVAGGFSGGIGVVYTERVSRFDLGLMLIGQQEYRGRTVNNNGGFMASLVVERPERFWQWLPDEMYLGPTAWVQTDDRLISCHLGFNLGVRWTITERFHAGWRHWSNAGTCKPNHGQDLLVFGVRF